MKTFYSIVLFILVPSGLTSAREPVTAPKNVPPIVATAITSSSSEAWSVQLTIPTITWKVVGERRPKVEWPEFQVNVDENVLNLPLDYHPATALSETSQNRVVDLSGKRLTRDDVEKRLKDEMPVLVSVSGQMPDAFYLQCTSPDTLIVILGIPTAPAPQFLPREAVNIDRTEP